MEPHHPTLLRRPAPFDIPSVAEDVLPGNPWDYAITQIGEVWTVKAKSTGEWIYKGPGPVEVFKSPAPF